jgi:threonine/homoserine/homoserine lactone efflux protein
MTVWDWLTLASVCGAGAISPGPSLLVVLRSTLSGSWANGIATSWAHAVGVGGFALVVALGLGATVAAIPSLEWVLKIGGVAFLLYLAYRSLRSTGGALPDPAVETRNTGPRDGFLIAVLNPKLLIWVLALFSQFIAPESTTLERVGMGALALVIDGAWYSVVVTAVSFGPVLSALRARAVLIDRVFGVLLLFVAVRLLWT